MRWIQILAVFCVIGISGMPAAADWLRFRGPNGSGISSEDNAVPTRWSPDSVKWKVETPGPGSSCPIVVGDKVFITCWTGYAMIREVPGELEDLRRHLICYDRKTGKELWRSTVAPLLPEDRYSGMFAEHGYASHTPVSDGEHVFAFFGKSGVVAYDLDGNKLWQKTVGTGLGDKNWGSSSSPLFYRNMVIVPATAENTAVVALDKKTGDQLWESKSGGYGSTWGSPILVETDNQTELVLAVPYEIWALNPDTGKLNWYVDAIGSSSFCSSCIVDPQGVVYAMESGPRGGGSIAVRAGGTKDVTESHVVWSRDQASRIITPIVHDGRIYSFSRGIATILDAETGDELERSRLRNVGAGGPSTGRRGGQDYGSPVMADGKIYFTTRSGATHVLQPEGDALKTLSVNLLTEESEDFSATPAVSDGALYFRSDMHLYCIR